MRPEILNPLFAETKTLDGVGPKLAKPLEKLGLSTIKDVAYHLPERFVSRRAIANLDEGGEDRFIGNLNEFWGDKLVSEITPDAIYRSAPKIYPGCTGATWNRQAIVPAIAAINLCAEKGWCAPIKSKRHKVNAKSKVPADLSWINSFASQACEDG